MSYISSIKSVLAGFLAWLGIHISHLNEWFRINITDGSISFYLINLLVFALIVYIGYDRIRK